MITCTFEKGYTNSLRHAVVHAIVLRGQEILLEKRAGDLSESGKWALPGGFLERDETAAEGTLRELYEETGWEGKIKCLFRINSKPERRHEDRQNVVFEYLVDPIAKTGGTDWETSKVEWIPFDNLLPFDEFAFDHGDSIRLAVEYTKKQFPLPIIL